MYIYIYIYTFTQSYEIGIPPIDVIVTAEVTFTVDRKQWGLFSTDFVLKFKSNLVTRKLMRETF